VPSRRVPDANPAAEDEEAEEANIEPAGDPGDIEPEHSGRFFDSYFRSSTDLKSISEIDCIFFTGTPSDSIRGLIALLRSAVSGADINQEFNAFAGQSPAPSIVPIPERREPILNYSQRRILNMKKVYKLNLRATNAIMTLVQDPKFKSSELGTNRVQNLNRILLRGYGGDVSEYDFHTAVDGKQDLKMYTRGIEQVASEIFSDPRFKGSMTFTFVPTFDEEGRRTFGSAMGGVWAQYHARAIVDGVEVLLVLAIYIDASYVKVNLTVKPIYCKQHPIPYIYCEQKPAQALNDLCIERLQ
jgi:hypothetical protein